MAMTEADFPSLGPVPAPAAALNVPATHTAGSSAWASVAAASSEPSTEPAREASAAQHAEHERAGGHKSSRHHPATEQQQQQRRGDMPAAPAVASTAGDASQDGQRSISSEDDDMAEMLTNLGIVTPAAVPGAPSHLLLCAGSAFVYICPWNASAVSGTRDPVLNMPSIV